MACPIPRRGGQGARPALRRKVDAQRWLDEVTASIVTGQYVDPNAGRITFREYAEQWRAAQVHRPTSAAHVETMLRRHAYPTFGDRPLAAILPSEIQAWVRLLSDGRRGRKPLAPATIAVLHGVVSAIFRAAVRDRRIIVEPVRRHARCPARSAETGRPAHHEQVDPASDAAGARGARHVRRRHRDASGRDFGLTVDRVDFLRREVRVDRQLLRVAGRRAGVRAAEDAGERPHHPAAPGRRRGARRAPRGASGERATIWCSPSTVRRSPVRPSASVATGRQAVGPRARDRDARPAALLRVAAHPIRRVGQDRPGPPRPRDSGRDAGHLQPPVAGLGRPTRTAVDSVLGQSSGDRVTKLLGD